MDQMKRYPKMWESLPNQAKACEDHVQLRHAVIDHMMSSRIYQENVTFQNGISSEVDRHRAHNPLNTNHLNDSQVWQMLLNRYAQKHNFLCLLFS